MADKPLELVFGSVAKGETETSYVPSPEVGVIAERLLDTHLTLARLRTSDLNIAYCLQAGADPQKVKGRERTMDSIGRAIKAPPLWRDLAGVDGVIWVNEVAWNGLSERLREAVVLHELLHFDVEVSDDGDEKLVVLKHDIEEFGLVVSTYGPWHGGLERFAEQIKMGLDRQK